MALVSVEIWNTNRKLQITLRSEGLLISAVYLFVLSRICGANYNQRVFLRNYKW